MLNAITSLKFQLDLSWTVYSCNVCIPALVSAIFGLPLPPYCDSLCKKVANNDNVVWIRISFATFGLTVVYANVNRNLHIDPSFPLSRKLNLVYGVRVSQLYTIKPFALGRIQLLLRAPYSKMQSSFFSEILYDPYVSALLRF